MRPKNWRLMKGECGMNNTRLTLKPAPWPLGRVRIRLIGTLALIATLIAGTLVARHRANADKPGGLPLDGGQCWTVQRGPLIISLLAPGTIKAKTSNEIKCMVPRRRQNPLDR